MGDGHRHNLCSVHPQFAQAERGAVVLVWKASDSEANEITNLTREKKGR